jgi:hypothetical protein
MHAPIMAYPHGSGEARSGLVHQSNATMVVFGRVLREISLASAVQVRSRSAVNGLLAVRESGWLRTSALADDAPLVGAAQPAFVCVLTDPLQTSARACGR